ncbi:hypothetical protein F5Y06DRAFT_302353 [Hypoxylon sp. FL0890]|nr:hypothetical protein F5Y06DRAFT_302353 [Hypoxylon sp. FL0890]
MASFNHFGTHIEGYTNQSSSNPFSRASTQHFPAYQAGDNGMVNPFENDHLDLLRDSHQTATGNSLHNPFGNPFQKKDEATCPSQDIVMTDAPPADSLDSAMDEFLPRFSEPTDATDPDEMCCEPEKVPTYPIQMDIDSSYDNAFDFQPTISECSTPSASRPNKLHEIRQSRPFRNSGLNEALDFSCQTEASNTDVAEILTRDPQNFGEFFSQRRRKARRWKQQRSTYYNDHRNSPSSSYGRRH